MKKMWLAVAVLIISVFGYSPACYAINAYGATALTGGTSGCLDAIDGSDLNDGDVAFVVYGGNLYTFVLDVDSAAVESSPLIIAPDSNGGDKRWLLQDYGVGTLTADSATPAVSSRKKIFKTANVNPTTITALTGGFTGQRIVVIINDAVTTIDFSGTTLKGNAGVDWSPGSGDWMECIFDGTNWYCSVHDTTA